MFCSTLSARSARIVPRSAFFGSVAPISCRLRAMTFSPSSTITTIGPDDMNSVSEPKKGRSRCTA